MSTFPRVLHEQRDSEGKLIARLVQLAPNLIAIDLECQEALRLARYFLPKIPMAVEDRPGKPGSRWLYRVNSKGEIDHGKGARWKKGGPR